MEEPENPELGDPASGVLPPGPTFRWQAFFQQAAEPIFLLSHRRRLLFVNRAWEELTGLPVAQARGLRCRSRRTGDPCSLEEVLARALAPPPEVLEGKPGRASRWVARTPSCRQWWDLEFWPVRGQDGLLGVLGKITRVTATPTTAPPLPEKLLGLREALAQRYSLQLFTSQLPALERVADQVRLASQTRIPVLLVGEPGTGKRWLARTIHHRDADRDGTFVALDCERLPAEALTTVLFGEGRRVWETGRSTCYLHEPSYLPRDLQARLCDLVSEAEDPAGPRVLAGCSKDPDGEVQAGRLLEELHCALSTLRIVLPPLRQRMADLPWLVQQILDTVNSDGDRRILGLTQAAWELVRGYAWPGNLRELHSVLRGARLRAAGEQIDAADLPSSLRVQVQLDRTPGVPAERPLPLDELLEQTERRLIVLALRRAKGNKSRAAELLSIWRPRLLRRMEALGITDPGEE